jgi:alpha,alpha-trehalase
MQYLFSKMDSLRSLWRNRTLFLLLDFDGTLTPIAQKPQDAAISMETRDLLIRISKTPESKVAVISGRSLRDVKQLVAIDGIIYAGNHGMEMEGPDFSFQHPLPEGYGDCLKKLSDILQRDLADIRGLLFEEKGFGLSIHYRNVPPDRLPGLMNYFNQADQLFLQNHVKRHDGKMVFELRPSLAWDKGRAVLWLLERQGNLKSGQEFYPVYIGDDQTDEDAFAALKNSGLTVVVGRVEHSCAQYYLEDTADVMRFLRQIADAEKS